MRPKVPKIAHKHDGAYGTEIEFEEGEAVRPNVIRRWECSECGESTDWVHPDEDRYACSTHVDAGVVERVYVPEAECERRVAQAREGYWPAGEVLEALREEERCQVGPVNVEWAAKFLEHRFSEEGTS